MGGQSDTREFDCDGVAERLREEIARRRISRSIPTPSMPGMRRSVMITSYERWRMSVSAS